MSNSQFELALISATLVRTVYYAFVYWMVYKGIKKNETPI